MEELKTGREPWFPSLRGRVAFVHPLDFYGYSWWRYLRPRRITLRGPGRIAIYRWLCWNITIKRAGS